MKTVARFRNPADAAFFQSLLESESIEAEVVTDGGIGLGGDIHVQVDDCDFARAAEIAAKYEQAAPERAALAEATHPAKGFPFRRVWAITAWGCFIVFDGLAVLSMMTNPKARPPFSVSGIVQSIYLFIGVPILYSLPITFVYAMGWISWRALRKRRVT